MAQFTIYRSSDGSAPTLDGTVGSLVNLLDKCLVTGYGAKSAAGWTKPYTGTDKAVFRPGAGTQFYLRVQDDAPGSGGAKEARITGYETMSDVDTGTGPFPTAAQGLGGVTAAMVARKSASADATARTWIVVADSRTVYVFVITGDIASNYYSFAFGDFYSFKSDDAYNCLLIGRYQEDSGADNYNVLTYTRTTLTGVCEGNFFARGHTQLGGSVKFGKHGDTVKSGGSDSFVGIVPFTNPEDGGIYLTSCWIHDPTTAPVNGCRGRMRGLWIPCHPYASFTDGDTFSGDASGELTGKTFLAIKNHRFVGIDSTAIIETSNTLETN